MIEQANRKAPYVFLSYASAEQERALAVGDALQQAGIAIWLDRHAIAGGSAWSTEIVRGIRDCAAFVVLGSKRAFRSPNVQRELNLAVEENRPVLPLLLEQVSPPDGVRYALAGQQWVSLLEREQTAWLPEVVRALAGLGIVPTTPAPGTEPFVMLPVAAPPTNLPSSLTSFLGREQELADLARLVLSNRLVTLTGPGGTGKTRLALQVASNEVERFPDGIFFIDLAPLADPALVPSAVAQALSVQGMPEMALRDSVLRFMREKRLLLLLDNYEHLLAATEFAGAMLQSGPGVTLLVTSRAPLRVTGEREYAVAPLLVPMAGSHSTTELGQNPAVQLFVLRAQAVRADFTLTAENAPTVAAICTRLDGLPLAIELAAARTRALPVAVLLARLAQRLPLLTGGARDVPARQQTLRDTIGWSYDLLEPAEQRLFRRLGVFAGGCTLELAEAVCTADGDLGLDVLDGVSSLVEKSLLRAVDGLDGEPRYRTLETIREFALGELEASGEAEEVRRQLAVQVLQLVRQWTAASNWPRLDADLDNVRAVLGWCVDQTELAVGGRLLWAMQRYLFNRGAEKEKQLWRQRLLSLPPAALPTSSRARLLTLMSLDDLSSLPDLDRAAAELEEAIGLSRQLGDIPCLARALQLRSFLDLRQGHYEAVVPLAEEALALYLDAGVTHLALRTRGLLLRAALARGDLPAAEALVAANRALARATGTTVLFIVLQEEAWLAEARGDDAQTRMLLEESVRREGAEQGERSPSRLLGLAHLASVVLRQGDIAAAVTTCAESLRAYRQVGSSSNLPTVLHVLAQAAERYDLLSQSVRLLAVIDTQRHVLDTAMFGWQATYQASVARVRAELGESAFAEAWAAGESLSPDAAIELGLAVVAELQQLLATETAAAEQS